MAKIASKLVETFGPGFLQPKNVYYQFRDRYSIYSIQNNLVEEELPFFRNDHKNIMHFTEHLVNNYL